MKKIIGAMMVVLFALALEQLFMALQVRNLKTGCNPTFGSDLGVHDGGSRD